jgi:hypothetical protein
VDALLQRGAVDDVAEAHEAIDRLSNLPADSPICQIMVLSMRTLLVRAGGDELTYPLACDGEIAWLPGASGVGRGDAVTQGGQFTAPRVTCGPGVARCRDNRRPA